MQGLFTWPDIQNNFVPLLFGLPNDANQFAPLLMIVGQTDTVSTLVTVVGHPYNPLLAGNGGLSLGLPCFPSRDYRSPVSSPQIYAPAPEWTYTSKSIPEPQAFLPRNPFSYAS